MNATTTVVDLSVFVPVNVTYWAFKVVSAAPMGCCCLGARLSFPIIISCLSHISPVTVLNGDAGESPPHPSPSSCPEDKKRKEKKSSIIYKGNFAVAQILKIAVPLCSPEVSQQTWHMNTLRLYLSARLRLLRFTPAIVQLGGGCAGTLLSAECGQRVDPATLCQPDSPRPGGSGTRPSPGSQRRVAPPAALTLRDTNHWMSVICWPNIRCCCCCCC